MPIYVLSVSLYSSVARGRLNANFHHLCSAEFSFDIDFMFKEIYIYIYTYAYINIYIYDNSLWGFVYDYFLLAIALPSADCRVELWVNRSTDSDVARCGQTKFRLWIACSEYLSCDHCRCSRCAAQTKCFRCFFNFSVRFWVRETLLGTANYMWANRRVCHVLLVATTHSKNNVLHYTSAALHTLCHQFDLCCKWNNQPCSKYQIPKDQTNTFLTSDVCEFCL